MKRLVFYALLLFSGSYLWANGGAYPDFYVIGGNAYFHDSVTVFCVDVKTQKFVWQLRPQVKGEFPKDYSKYNFCGVNRIFPSNEYIYVNTYDKRMLVCEKLTGYVAAEPEFDNLIMTYPIIEDSVIYFGGKECSVYAYNLHNLKQIWRYQIGANATNSLFSNKYLYFGANDRNFYAVDKKFGSQQWLQSFISIPKTRPVMNQKRMFMGGLDGTLYCLDPDNGGIYWQTKNPAYWGEDINPLIAGENVIVKYDTTAVMAVSVKRMEAVGEWFGSRIDGKSLMIKDSILYFVGGDTLYRGNAYTLEQLKPYSLETSNISVPVISGDKMYFKSKNKLWVIDLNTQYTEKIFDYGIYQHIKNNIQEAGESQLQAVFKNVVYTDEARAAGASGQVIVMAFVDKSGKILYRFVSETDSEILSKICLDAVDKTSKLKLESEPQGDGLWIAIPFVFRFE